MGVYSTKYKMIPSSNDRSKVCVLYRMRAAPSVGTVSTSGVPADAGDVRVWRPEEGWPFAAPPQADLSPLDSRSQW